MFNAFKQNTENLLPDDRELFTVLFKRIHQQAYISYKCILHTKSNFSKPFKMTSNFYI